MTIIISFSQLILKNVGYAGEEIAENKQYLRFNSAIKRIHSHIMMYLLDRAL